MEAMDVLDVGRMAVCMDPAGAAFSLWQPMTHQGSGLANEAGAFSWNELLTTDVPGSIEFYGKVFGWEGKTYEGDMPYTELSLNGRSIGGMMQKPPMMPAEAPPSWLVYFAVEDLSASLATVKANGGAQMMEPMTIPQGTFSLVSDPAGAVFYLIQLGAGT
jgi:predicted enzyme related to lactoylglutathione lyase